METAFAAQRCPGAVCGKLSVKGGALRRAPAARVPSQLSFAVSVRADRVFLHPVAVKAQHRGKFSVVATASGTTTTVAGAQQGSKPSEVDCVIVGGGISGLCAALSLVSDHADVVKSVVVTEARDRVGGNITTVSSEDGYLWEEGPNSFQPNDAMLKCALDAGCLDELVFGDPDAPRFVFWEGRLRPVPGKPLDLPVFDLMSIFGKIRAGLGAMGLRPAPPEGVEETVEQFVRRNLGAEVFERLIEPFCSGVYAGDPSKLSMKAAFGRVWRLEDIGGSIIGGSLALLKQKQANPPPPRDERLPKAKGQTVGSFKKGLITLPNAIAAKLGDRINIGWKLLSVSKLKSGSEEGFLLTYDTPAGEKQLKARTVLLTLPAYTAADILRATSEAAAKALSSFYYPPVAAVTISYPSSALKPERLTNGQLLGFGQLHPRSQGITTLGTIYSSSLFPNRAPDGRVLLLCYIGGALNTAIATTEADDIVATVDKDLRKMLIREDAPPPTAHGVRVWQRAIPQFNVGHLDVLEDAKSALQAAGMEGLFLGGNYVAGVALGRCVEGGYESANEVVKYLKASAKV